MLLMQKGFRKKPFLHQPANLKLNYNESSDSLFLLPFSYHQESTQLELN